MNFIFFGIQGSGKGTQAKIISKKYKLAHISTGDLLRNSTGELKKEVEVYMKSGKLVPDELMLKILKERIKEKDCEKGFILDGFPRTLEQANELDKIIKINNAFNIEISDQEAMRRLGGRLSCKNCGAIFNEATNPPKEPGICDNCSSPLSKRADDNPESIKKRIEIYHQETKPLIKHYNTIKVNGEQSIELVTGDIEKAIKFLTMFS